MKARQHLLAHSIILILLLIIIFLFIRDKIFNFFNLEIIIGIGLYLLGAILPDVDSNNKGSYIYHKKWLFFLAHIVSWLEYPIAKLITKRQTGHRESIHTIIGITITSLFVVMLITILYNYLLNILTPMIILFWFICLFIGQFFHLIEDIQQDWKPTLK